MRENLRQHIASSQLLGGSLEFETEVLSYPEDAVELGRRLTTET